MGNEYEATYPKRAKGLVKNGRARFVNDNTICLACPPNKILEDNIMDNEIININNTETQALTIEYILTRMDWIIKDTTYIKEALIILRDIDTTEINNFPDARAKSIGDIIESRESTNQQTLRFLEKMYDDLKPKQNVEAMQSKAMDTITSLMALAEDIEQDKLKMILDSVRNILG